MKIPTDPHAEMAVLGSVLLNPEALYEVAAVLGPTPDCFHDRRNAALYEAMLRIQGRGETPDTTTILSDLGGRVPGIDAAYLGSLVSSDVTYTSARAAQYAEAVKGAHTRRKVLEECRNLACSAQDTTVPVENLLDRVGAAHTGLSLAYTSGDAVPVGACVDEALANLKRLADSGGKIAGISAGMPQVDCITGGWKPGDLIIIAARPSVGKTAFALNVALHAAQEGTPVFFASLEMDRGQLAQRLLCMTSSTRMDRFTSGFLARQALEGVERVAPVVAGLPLFVDDTPGATLWQLSAKVRRWQRKHPGGMVVVDYLQLLRTGQRYEKRHLEVAEISAGLKALGRELECPVLALCQLSREAESLRDGYSMLACLREAGSLEQDADLVLILTKLQEDEVKAKEEQYGKGTCDGVLPVYVAKHRNGPTGRALLLFDKETQRIGGQEDQPAPAAGPSEEDWFEEDDDTPF
jgi:replicative DNA helicase